MESVFSNHARLTMTHPPSKLLLLSGFLFTSASSFGAITYVDAQEGPTGNTFATGQDPSSTAWIDTTSNTSGADDANWMKRAGGSPGWSQHNGGDVIQGLVSGFPAGDLGQITTEVSGLSGGTYDVWVFFWEQTVSTQQNWLIDAGIAPNSLTAYSSPAGPVAGTDSTTPVDAGTLTFSNSPSTTAAGGNQTMYGVNLGQTTIPTGGSINVFVDKLTGTGSGNRTIYDGVGYELVAIPEPSSALLLALSGLALTARRRR